MDAIDLWRYLGALLLMGGLLGVALLGAKRFGIPGMAKPDRTRRLKVVETLMLSPRQRLVLVRRDTCEHLIVLGPEGALVIEQGLRAPPPEKTPPITTPGAEPAA